MSSHVDSQQIPVRASTILVKQGLKRTIQIAALLKYIRSLKSGIMTEVV